MLKFIDFKSMVQKKSLLIFVKAIDPIGFIQPAGIQTLFPGPLIELNFIFLFCEIDN